MASAATERGELKTLERSDPLEDIIVNWPGDPGCDVHVFLAATRFGMGAHNCLASLRRYGYAYTVLGWGEAWGGWRHRMALYARAAAKHAECGENTLVVFCDAFDVVAARPWQGLTAAYAALTARHGGAPLIFGAERLCMGKSIGLVHLGLSNCGCVDEWWAQTQEPRTQPTVYLNNGLLAGPAQAVAALYEWMLADARGFSDDQIGSKTFVNEHPRAAALDHTSVLFRNVQHFDALPPLSTGSEGTGPWFLHFPGSADVPQVFPLKEAWTAHAGRLAVVNEPATTARVSNALKWVMFALVCCALIAMGWGARGAWSAWRASTPLPPPPPLPPPLPPLPPLSLPLSLHSIV
jgi:hypothetical protein